MMSLQYSSGQQKRHIYFRHMVYACAPQAIFDR